MAASSSAVAVASAAQFDLLPIEIRERIFSLLPISTLAVSTSVSKTWLSVIRSSTFLSVYPTRSSPEDLYFLLFSPFPTLNVSVYRSHHDRWVSLTFPAIAGCPERILASDGFHLLAERPDRSMVACNLFTHQVADIPSMISFHSHSHSYVLGMFQSEARKGAWRYKIVAVSTLGDLRSQVYDSESGNWIATGVLPQQCALLCNPICLDETVYCLSRIPDRLLSFDTKSGAWGVVEVSMPSLVCCHLLEFRGLIYLVGGVEELGEVSRIGIWELNWKELTWDEVGFMPDGLFRRFSGSVLHSFGVVDRRGIICFCNTGYTWNYRLLSCDLSSMRWWRPIRCPFPVHTGNDLWLGHALEPRLEVIVRN